MTRALVRTIRDSNENLLINSNFRVNERDSIESALSVTANHYHIDRWKTQSFNGAAWTLQRLYGTNYEDTYLRMVCTTGAAGGYMSMMQLFPIYSVFALKTITVSCLMRSNSSLAKIRFRDGVVDVDSNYHSGSGLWEKLTLTVTCGTPSEAPNVRFGVEFNLLTIGDYVEFKQPKVEFGSFATEYLSPDPVLELVKCQSFYERVKICSSNSQSSSAMMAYDANSIQGNVNFKVVKRTTPTVSISSEPLTTIGIAGEGVLITNLSSLTVTAPDTYGCRINATKTSAFSTNKAYSIRSTSAGAVDVYADCELYS